MGGDMTVKELTDVLSSIELVRITKGRGGKYERSKDDLYIGWLGELKASPEHISPETWKAEVKHFAAVQDIKHNKWRELGLMQPLEPGKYPQYSFSDLTMSTYYTIYI